MNTKTAISLPPDVFRLSEKLSKRMKISRSAVFALAMTKLGEEIEEADFIERVNAVCAEVDTSVDPQLKRYQSERLKLSKW